MSFHFIDSYCERTKFLTRVNQKKEKKTIAIVYVRFYEERKRAGLQGKSFPLTMSLINAYSSLYILRSDNEKLWRVFNVRIENKEGTHRRGRRRRKKRYNYRTLKDWWLMGHAERSVKCESLTKTRSWRKKKKRKAQKRVKIVDEMI